ncbi:MAG: integrase family protein [Bauldia sp.]|nr:integrase family protein [Bauldia sp.]
MQKIGLTDVTIRSLKEGTYSDAKLPAFCIRVGKLKKTWFVVKGPRDRRRRVTLGHYPTLSLLDARKAAHKALGTTSALSPSLSFKEALDLFLEQDRWRPRSKVVISQSLRRNFHWMRSLDKITHEDVAQAVEAVKAKSARAHALKDIRTFFNWCVPRYLASSPAEGLAVAAAPVRERTLSADELVKVWNAAPRCGEPFGSIVRLLIVLGQRRTEVAFLHQEWISEDRIELPSWLTKNGKAHTFPIGPLTRSIFEEAIDFPAKGEGIVPFNGWSKSKARLDKLSGVTDWTLHDLRRTFATNLAALGTPIHVTEKILNHVSGTTGGLVGVYQKHTYWPEQVAAVTAWENRLQSILSR